VKKLLTIVVTILAFPAVAAADDWWRLDYAVLNSDSDDINEVCEAVADPDTYIQQANFGYNYSRVDQGERRQYILLSDTPQVETFAPTRRACQQLALDILKQQLATQVRYRRQLPGNPN